VSKVGMKVTLNQYFNFDYQQAISEMRNTLKKRCFICEWCA